MSSSMIGQIERHTQNRVIALFRDELYGSYGDILLSRLIRVSSDRGSPNPTGPTGSGR